MPKALIVYATRSGQTRKIADFLAEGMESAGVKTTVTPAADIKTGMDLEDYDSLIIGSPTYHGEMMSSIKALLAKAEKVRFQGKAGGAFGAYGWSGEAPKQIFDTMKNAFKMNMVDAPLKLKSVLVTESEKMIKDYGLDIAKKIGP